MDARIASLSEFWPYYLGEHRDPRCRAVHFVGTSGFFASVAVSFWWSPIAFSAAAVAIALLAVVGSAWVERRMPAFLPLLAMIALAAIISPWILLGVVFAYTCAWIGHFRIEHNRPATFKYPMWSLLCDFRMWGRMATGQLWAGDPGSTVS